MLLIFSLSGELLHVPVCVCVCVCVTVIRGPILCSAHAYKVIAIETNAIVAASEQPSSQCMEYGC
jgi:hypothetical protein